MEISEKEKDADVLENDVSIFFSLKNSFFACICC